MAGMLPAGPDAPRRRSPQTKTGGSESPIVITGPTGWIGSAFLATVARERGAGWAGTMRLFASSERAFHAFDGTMLAMRALSTIAPADLDGAIVIHLAYLTKEKVETLGESPFFETNLAIDEALLSALRGARPRGVFVASSGAASLAESGRDRHLYGVAKLLQEDRFLEYGRRSDVPVLAGRIFNIAGPYINKLSSYALSSFLCQALATGTIDIAARVPVYRSYLHVGDLCSLVLRTLEAGLAPKLPVELAGVEAVEMADVARAAAVTIGLDPDSAIRRGEIDFDRPSIYLGDPTWAHTAALRHDLPTTVFSQQVYETADFIRGSRTVA